jgi:hypothetical protein
MRAWWGLAVLATGCLSLQTGASANVAMTDTPVRRVGAPVLVGTFIPDKQLVIGLELTVTGGFNMPLALVKSVKDFDPNQK